jgi:hypothetical protein
LLNKTSPNIWWFIETIQSETAHFHLEYHRIEGGIVGESGFKERKRKPVDVEKDLELSLLKNKYLLKEIDEYELNKRASFFMHDFSEKLKERITSSVVTSSKSDIAEEYISLSIEDICSRKSITSSKNDITEEFLSSIEDISSSKAVKLPVVPFASPPVKLNFVEPIEIPTNSQKGVRDYPCDICGELWTKRGLNKKYNIIPLV